MRISAEQLVAARGLLRLTQADVAGGAAVHVETIRRFEAGLHRPRAQTLDTLRQLLESWGIEFQNSGRPGVRYHPDRDRRRLSGSASAKPAE
ncbi:MAG: helix-turn-helix transcriptional regulator [Myxococcales bacterium]|nr:helix-turn-helix transcriptional regulator [Myxococcales bacterium]